ncbi:ATP-binding protein [Streptomyces sp. ML-6]|uniref:ATP-binding protein n=1 Tax=Streptomyces sp. ML-6 TaxID=2982693 RepID=UPI0024C0165A|nr:ATP-binding protein [Streptomyces sp. ML-6]MDK0521333.1 ATP-binding protein [Streptomyces sp. ML-6]
MQVLQVQLEVGPDPAEVGRARRWARSRLIGSGIRDDEPLAETLILLISELVTNAVVHTGCPAVLRMLFGSAGGSGTVRVEVADASCRPPQQRHAEGEDTNGRGLELVDGLADRWGWQPEGAGKRIWCEVDRGAPVIQGVPGVHDVPCVHDVPGVHDVPSVHDVPAGHGARSAHGVQEPGGGDRAAYRPPRTVTRGA